MVRLACALVCLTCIFALTSCFKADVEVPSIPGVYVGGPPPPANIAPANPNSFDDLRRENTELRARINWLDEETRRLSRKYKDREGDVAKLQEEIRKLQAERDKYRRALGQ